MTTFLRLHSLGDFRDAIAPTADYPDAGTGSAKAKWYLGLGLFGAVGAVASEYLAVSHDGDLSAEGRTRLKDGLSHALWFAVRSVVEHNTHNAGLLWGHSIADIQTPAHVDTPSHAWLAMPRLLAQTNFEELHDAQIFLKALATAAARHHWSLQDLARHWATFLAKDLQAVGA